MNFSFIQIFLRFEPTGIHENKMVFIGFQYAANKAPDKDFKNWLNGLVIILKFEIRWALKIRWLAIS